MKEWKFRQELYHRLNQEHEDAPDDAVEMADKSDAAIIAQVFKYMGGEIPPHIIYPAKSYFVALVYARLLRDYFGENPIEVLDDPDLLYGNDPHFVPYSGARHIYDTVLAEFGWEFDIALGEIADVADWFRLEFQIEE